jgi:hypothetical protein
MFAKTTGRLKCGPAQTAKAQESQVFGRQRKKKCYNFFLADLGSYQKHRMVFAKLVKQ